MPSDADAATTASWRRLREFAIGAQHGWFEYLAGDFNTGRYLLRIGGRRRELHRDEPHGWIHALATVHGLTHLLDDVGPVPQLMALDEASAEIKMTKHGVNNRVNTGKLHPMFVPRPQGGKYRKLFADQVRADLDPDANDRWQQTRLLLPPMTRIIDIPDWEPAPSPDPLPIPAVRAERTRRWQRVGINERNRLINALRIGHDEGWIDYIAADPTVGLYTVAVMDTSRTRQEYTIAGDDVLPWVLGHGDYHGHPELVAYREGLG